MGRRCASFLWLGCFFVLIFAVARGAAEPGTENATTQEPPSGKLGEQSLPRTEQPSLPSDDGAPNISSSSRTGNGAAADEAAAAAAAPTTKAATAKKWNVLYLIADDLRPSLGIYDNNTLTPNIDALARASLRFQRAYAQAPKCTPSRSSFMTGRRPDNIKVWLGGQWGSVRTREPSLVTMPQWFKKNGYTVLGSGKTYHPREPPAWDPPSWSSERPYFPEDYYALLNTDAAQLRRAAGGGAIPSMTVDPYTQSDDYIDALIADAAIGHLQHTAASGKPFFIMCGFHAPHRPWHAPQSTWQSYSQQAAPQGAWWNSVSSTTQAVPGVIKLPYPALGPDGVPNVALSNEMHIVSNSGAAYSASSSYSSFSPLPASVVQELRRGYASSVSHMDGEVGRVLGTLKQLGLADNTIVVMHGDHGYSLGEHGHYEKSTLYESDVRVPLIIRMPNGSRNGQSSTEIVELVDLLPTLSDLVGLPRPPVYDGKSIAPLLHGAAESTSNVAYSQFPHCPLYSGRAAEWNNVCENDSFMNIAIMGYSVRTSTYRYSTWMPWLHPSKQADWSAMPTGDELYQYGRSNTQAGLFDFSTSNEAAKTSMSIVRLSLFLLLQQKFDKLKSFGYTVAHTSGLLAEAAGVAPTGRAYVVDSTSTVFESVTASLIECMCACNSRAQCQRIRMVRTASGAFTCTGLKAASTPTTIATTAGTVSVSLARKTGASCSSCQCPASAQTTANAKAQKCLSAPSSNFTTCNKLCKAQGRQDSYRVDPKSSCVYCKCACSSVIKAVTPSFCAADTLLVQQCAGQGLKPSVATNSKGCPYCTCA